MQNVKNRGDYRRTWQNQTLFAWLGVDFIKQTIREVIIHPECDPFASIQQSVMEHIPEHEQANLQALIIEELKRLHEGVLLGAGNNVFYTICFTY